MGAIRVSDFEGVITWASTATPAEVSSLAPTVLLVASEGDIVAQGIVDYAARELSQLALSLLQHFPENQPIQVAVTGGILSPERTLRSMVLSRLSEDSRLNLIKFSIEPALGALHLAEKLISE